MIKLVAMVVAIIKEGFARIISVIVNVNLLIFFRIIGIETSVI